MRDVVGYEGLYAITSCGKVWSYYTNKFLKPRVRPNGYLDVCLRKDGKNHTTCIHRLVAEAYIPNPEGLPQVGHRDESRDNNSILNLYWTDAKENSNTPLHKERVAKAQCKPVYCVELDRTFESAKLAAETLNLNNSHIGSCCRGERHTCGGYHWRYVV